LADSIHVIKEVYCFNLMPQTRTTLHTLGQPGLVAVDTQVHILQISVIVTEVRDFSLDVLLRARDTFIVRALHCAGPGQRRIVLSVLIDHVHVLGLARFQLSVQDTNVIHGQLFIFEAAVAAVINEVIWRL
jgi:hypothetical protein